MNLNQKVRVAAFFVLAALSTSSLALRTLAQAPQGQEGPPAAFGQNGRMIRGTVTAVTPDHLTLKQENGDTFQVAVTPSTQVRKGRDQMKFAEVKPGDGVGAMGEIDRPNKTVHAMMLFVVTAEQIKKAKEDMGKTYITGKLTAMDETKLTILRSDGVTQIIQVDEGTSFKRGGRNMQMAMSGEGMDFGPGASGGGRRGGATGSNGASLPTEARGGESITLADIKVGDLVGGPGAVKNGVFIPTELSIADPAARGQRRRPADGSTPAAPPSNQP